MIYNRRNLLIVSLFFVPMLSYATSDKNISDSHLSGVITQCSKLLPDNNKQYSINLDVILSSSNKTPKGNLSISDDSQKPLTNEEQKEIEKFKNCLINKMI